MGLSFWGSDLKNYKFYGLAVLFFICMFVYLTLEILNSDRIIYAYSKIFNQFNYVVLSSVAIYFLVLILFFLINNLFLSSSFVFIILFLFYSVNFYRKKITGWVFTSSDFVFYDSLFKLLKFNNNKLSLNYKIVGSILIITLILIFIKTINKKYDFNFSLKKRIGFFIISCFLFYSVFFSHISQNLFLTNFFKFNIYLKLTTNQIYKKYGFLLGFYTINEQNKNLKPDNYSEEYVKKLRYKIKRELPNKEKNICEDVSLIVIMSESFCDISRWPNVNFSSDPIKNFHELQKKYTNGNLIVPVFGGSTCNTEYEFLTGNALYFLKSSAMPYQEPEIYFKNKNIETLPRILKKNGYRTIALHTYDGNFFNRNIIYKKIGFDEFISKDDFKDPDYKGLYISDNFFTDNVIEICNKNMNRLFFLFGITMQNHYPYNKEKYSNEVKIKIKGNNLNIKEIESLECYVEGLRDADIELNRLINFLKTADQKIILVFFGDHLPIIADSGFDFYKKIDLIKSNDVSEWSTKDYYSIYNTPFIIFRNFDFENLNIKEISPYFLGNELLNILEVKKSINFRFLDIAFKSFCVLRENLFINKNHEMFSFVNSNYDLINDFFCLEYKNIYK